MRKAIQWEKIRFCSFRGSPDSAKNAINSDTSPYSNSYSEKLMA